MPPLDSQRLSKRSSGMTGSVAWRVTRAARGGGAGGAGVDGVGGLVVFVVAQAENGDTVGGGEVESVDEVGFAAALVAGGDDEEDAPALLVGEVFGDAGDRVPEMEIAIASGLCFDAVQEGMREGGGYGELEVGAIDGGIECGADEAAIEGVESDVVVGLEELWVEFGEGVGEGADDVALRAAVVEEDGEGERVVALHAHAGGLEGRAAVERDEEFFAGDGRKRLEVGAEYDGGELHEVGVDVQRVVDGLG